MRRKNVLQQFAMGKVELFYLRLGFFDRALGLCLFGLLVLRPPAFCVSLLLLRLLFGPQTSRVRRLLATFCPCRRPLRGMCAVGTNGCRQGSVHPVASRQN